MRVTVERISNNDNPIADEKYEGRHIHIPNGEEGKTYEIEILDMYGKSYAVGLVDELPRSERIELLQEEQQRNWQEMEDRIEKEKAILNHGEAVERNIGQKQNYGKNKAVFRKRPTKNSLLNGKF